MSVATISGTTLVINIPPPSAGRDAAPRDDVTWRCSAEAGDPVDDAAQVIPCRIPLSVNHARSPGGRIRCKKILCTTRLGQRKRGHRYDLPSAQPCRAGLLVQHLGERLEHLGGKTHGHPSRIVGDGAAKRV